MTENNNADNLPIQREESQLPDFLSEEKEVQGLENFTRDDVKIPRLAICQDSSNEKKESHPLYNPNLHTGDFFNSIDKTNYGQTLLVNPLFFFKSRIKFASKTDKTIQCISYNGRDGGVLSPLCEKCKFAQFVTNAEGQKYQPCTGFFNYLVRIIEKDQEGNMYPHGDILIFGMKRTSAKMAKIWNSLISARNKSIFSGLYEISTANESNKDGLQYLVPVINNAGWISKDLYEQAKGLYLRYKDTGIKNIDVDSVVEEVITEPAQQTNTEYAEDDIPF